MFVGALFVVLGAVCIGTCAVLARSSYPRLNAAHWVRHRSDAALVEPVAEAWTRRTLWFGIFVGFLMFVIGVASIIIGASR